MRLLTTTFTTSTLLLSALAALSTSITNVTVLDPNVQFLPANRLPSPGAASNADIIAQQFADLGRTTTWRIAEMIHLDPNLTTGEPEGMVRLTSDRYLICAGIYSQKTVSFGNGTVINGTDRSPGVGVTHMFLYDGSGKRIADAQLSKVGNIEYHIGGCDYDGEYVYATIAQYRPNTTATVVRVDPRTMEGTEMFHYRDHLGGIVHNTKTNELATLNWGSRNATIFDHNAHDSTKNNRRSIKDNASSISTGFATARSVVRNPSYFVDYQDCKFLGYPKMYKGRAVMFCSGVATLGSGSNMANVGGLALVDIETMVPLAEVPMMLLSDLGVPMTQNPVDVTVINGKMRFYFAPDQNNTTIYGVEAVVPSPYEF